MPVLLVTTGADPKLESCTEYDDVCAASDAYDFMINHCTQPMRVGLVQAAVMPNCVLFTPMCYQDINGFDLPPEKDSMVKFYRPTLN